jgi:hypothetical protein
LFVDFVAGEVGAHSDDCVVGEAASVDDVSGAGESDFGSASAESLSPFEAASSLGDHGVGRRVGLLAGFFDGFFDALRFGDVEGGELC